MSELRVDNIVDMGGSGAPQLRKGANVTGISTITQAVVGNTTINAGGINATGIVTSSSNKFVGDLASGNITAGVMTATSSVVASNITINSGGVNASGIVSATSYQGSGANLTGIGLTIAPLEYNPDVSDHLVKTNTGIGLTFNQRVSAGTGNVTLSLVSVGSTVVENFGVGSSVSIDGNTVTINPTADLARDTVYAISYPSGAFTQSGAGGSFVGTAYTFYTVKLADHSLWGWGRAYYGETGQNDTVSRSSPVQIGSNVNWLDLAEDNPDGNHFGEINANGELWMQGYNSRGQLGQNNRTQYSSPVQIPGTTWGESKTALGNKTHLSINIESAMAIKTDGTLWVWGYNRFGQLGLNNASPADVSSPTQIPGTTWKQINAGYYDTRALKTDGTLWAWGYGDSGQLGVNSRTQYSSPVQVPGTNWSQVDSSTKASGAIKTDGTLWSWGYDYHGMLGRNTRNEHQSSPVQVPGTNWGTFTGTAYGFVATKTDGTLWAWGDNYYGVLGQNNTTHYSSPVQIPGTGWPTTDRKKIQASNGNIRIIKTDGTLWAWGENQQGSLGQDNVTHYSSPVQIPGTNWITVGSGAGRQSFALREQ